MSFVVDGADLVCLPHRSKHVFPESFDVNLCTHRHVWFLAAHAVMVAHRRARAQLSAIDVNAHSFGFEVMWTDDVKHGHRVMERWMLEPKDFFIRFLEEVHEPIEESEKPRGSRISGVSRK